MSFNWPDIPFSGTEVDAFVVAYKEFAQEILDAFPKEFYSESTDVGHLLLPYGTKQNLKAIKKLGISKHHRKTFSPINNYKTHNI